MNDYVARDLVPVAAELVGAVRDFGPEIVQKVLGRVDADRMGDLAVVLAAMVDPDKRPSQLLAWTTRPVMSREWEPPSKTVERIQGDDLCRRKERRAEVARLTAAGVSAADIADRLGITARSVGRHRAAIREAREKAS